MATTVLKKDSKTNKSSSIRSEQTNKSLIDLSLFVGKVKLEKDAVLIQREIRDGK